MEDPKKITQDQTVMTDKESLTQETVDKKSKYLTILGIVSMVVSVVSALYTYYDYYASAQFDTNLGMLTVGCCVPAFIIALVATIRSHKWVKGAEKHELEKKKPVRAKRVGIVAIVLSLILGLTFGYLTINQPSDWGDPSAREGYYEGKTDEEIIADLNAKVAEGEFNISCNSIMTKNEDGTYNARLENIKANHRDCKVTIYLTYGADNKPDVDGNKDGSADDADDVIYQSGAFSPGEYIENVELTKYLPKGTYDITVLFTTYTQDTHQKTGAAAAEAQLVVS